MMKPSISGKKELSFLSKTFLQSKLLAKGPLERFGSVNG